MDGLLHGPRPASLPRLNRDPGERKSVQSSCATQSDQRRPTARRRQRGNRPHGRKLTLRDSPRRTRIAPWRACGASVAISSIPRSLPITAASSSALATAASLSFAQRVRHGGNAQARCNPGRRRCRVQPSLRIARKPARSGVYSCLTCAPASRATNSAFASAISGISTVGEKPSSAGSRTAWASAWRLVD